MLLCLVMPAQNGINQSVEVSNDYKTQMSDLTKGEVRMSIPDTLQEFDYHFDYSVFDSPYKGAYEFSPYFVQMTPDKSVYDGKKFWLRGGAGYSLHPVLDFFWTPVRTANAGLTVYNNGNAYIGNYIFGPTENNFSGYDASDKLRLQADFIGKGYYARVNGGWGGFFSKSIFASGMFNSVDLDVDVRSRTNSPSFFYYDFDFGYKYISDNLNSLGIISGHDVRLTGCVGPVIKKKFRILVDFMGELEMVQSTYSGMDRYNHFIGSATPHLVFDAGPVHLDAGVVIDYSRTDKDLFTLSPSVKANVTIVKDVVDFYAGFVGGQKMHTYSSLKDFNHFDFAMVPIVTQLRYDAYGGFKGAIGRNFDYNLKVGYLVADNALLDFCTIQFGNVSKFYIDLNAAWRSERLEVDGDFSVSPKSSLYSGIGFQTPRYKGDLRAVYNWNKRIYLGVRMKTCSPRKSPDFEFKSVPWYLDLGVVAEYKFSPSFGVWAEGGNLLGHRVYDTIGYIMKDPYFTVGISCSL